MRISCSTRPPILPRAARRTTLPRQSGDGAGLTHLPAALLHGIRAGVDTVLHPTELAELPRRGRALAELLLRNEVRAAPHTSLNGPIGKQRRFAVADARLEDLKAIKRALGGTVNDVALAAATGGLRALLEARGEQPPSARACARWCRSTCAAQRSSWRSGTASRRCSCTSRSTRRTSWCATRGSSMTRSS